MENQALSIISLSKLLIRLLDSRNSIDAFQNDTKNILSRLTLLLEPIYKHGYYLEKLDSSLKFVLNDIKELESVISGTTSNNSRSWLRLNKTCNSATFEKTAQHYKIIKRLNSRIIHLTFGISSNIRNKLTEQECFVQIIKIPTSNIKLNEHVAGSPVDCYKILSGTYNGQLVAIKQFRSTSFELPTSPIEEDSLEVSVNMFNTLKSFSNLNKFIYFTRFIGCMSIKNNFGIVTEWVDGKTLFENKDDLPPDQLMSIAIGITTGLNHLHSNCYFVHNSLTSKNIYLVKYKNVLIPKIHNFGTAKLNTISGKPISPNVLLKHEEDLLPWSPPEFWTETFDNALKHKSYPFKKDIYGLGVIFCELFLCYTPKARSCPKWSTSALPEELKQYTTELELAVVSPCLIKDPKLRCDSVQLMNSLNSLNEIIYLQSSQQFEVQKKESISSLLWILFYGVLFAVLGVVLQSKIN
eukprot:NODE_281_length_11904_cov_0.253452.p3 type:complete len:467 gc:universal NODE_281_length_11904_cov_0.253452:933-2333(+)